MLMCWLIDLLIHWLMNLFIDDSLIHWFNDSLINMFFDLLIMCVLAWFYDWLVVVDLMMMFKTSQATKHTEYDRNRKNNKNETIKCASMSSTSQRNVFLIWNRASRQVSQPASKQASKQGSKEASKQASKAAKQASILIHKQTTNQPTK